MTNRKIMEIALKLWGVVSVVSAISVVIRLATIGFMSSYDERYSSALLTAGVTAAAGLMMIVFAEAIASRLFPESISTEIRGDSSEILAMAFAVLGMYFLIEGMQHGAVVLYDLLAKPKWDEVPIAEYLWDKRSEAMVRGAVEVVAGAGLILGAGVFSRVWFRLRGRSPNSGQDRTQ